MKRIIVWVDSADKETIDVQQQIKDFLSQAGLKFTVFDCCELVVSETE